MPPARQPVAIRLQMVVPGESLSSLCLDSSHHSRLPPTEPHLRSATSAASSTRLAAFGQVVSGLTPPLADLLTVIVGRSRLLLEAHESEPAKHDAVREVYVAAEKAMALLRRVQVFAGHEVAHPAPIDLNQFLGESAHALRQLAEPDVTVEIELGAEMVAVAADPRLLEQVLIELVQNAREAMPAGGKLVVSTTIAEIDPAAAERLSDARSGRFAVIRITDTGCGIVPELRPRLFEPFFTTKATAAHLGLGLAVVFGVVRQLDGWVAVESSPAGTAVRVYLPALPVRLAAATSGLVRRGGLNAILLVDDDRAVRELTAAVMEHQFGFRVLQAATAEEALETWQWHGWRTRILITDIVLGGDMNGVELARRLRADRPDLGIICTSGHGDEILRRMPIPAGSEFVAKPWHMQTLTRAIHAVMDQAPAGRRLSP